LRNHTDVEDRGCSGSHSNDHNSGLFLYYFMTCSISQIRWCSQKHQQKNMVHQGLHSTQANIYY